MKEKINNLVINGGKIILRNFAGKPGDYNPEGRRNFCVTIDDPRIAEQLKLDGWNIRYLTNKLDPEDRKAILQVTVNYGYKPPKIVMISSRGKNILPEKEVNTLDWAEIKYADVIIAPYVWNQQGNIKAYLKSLYVTIEENKEELELERKYYDLPDTAINTLGGCGNCEECDGSCREDD